MKVEAPSHAAAAAKAAAAAASARPVSPEATSVFHIMSREVICVSPRMRLEELAALFLENTISGAPVVDDAGRLVGIVSATDVVRDLHERQGTEEVDNAELRARRGVRYTLGPGFHVHDPGAAVSEVMSRKVLTVTESCSVRRAAELMARHHVHRLPVLDDKGAIVGLVSSLDILGWLAGLG